jgi:hypothetical protein
VKPAIDLGFDHRQLMWADAVPLPLSHRAGGASSTRRGNDRAGAGPAMEQAAAPHPAPGSSPGQALCPRGRRVPLTSAMRGEREGPGRDGVNVAAMCTLSAAMLATGEAC